MNAKREHLRARIGVVLGFQAHLAFFCEIIGNMIRQVHLNNKFLVCWKRIQVLFSRYDMNDLEIRRQSINIFHHLNPTFFVPLSSQRDDRFIMPEWSLLSQTSNAGLLEQVDTETGFYYSDYRNTHDDRKLFQDDDQTCLLKRTDELRDLIEESNSRIHSEIKKVALSIQTELEDMKKNFFQVDLHRTVA